MNIPKLYIPHANQRLIHLSKARNRVAVCGRRFGKSALLLNEALSLALQVSKQIAWIILPLYRQAKEVYWIDPDITKYFMPYVQAGICKADKSELSLYFKHTDSWVRLKGSDNYDSLRGSGIDFIGWDEVADVKEEAFTTIEPALADSPNHRQMYVGTPKGLNWFHDFALRGDHRGRFTDFGKKIKLNSDWESWHFTSYDNLSWPENSVQRKAFVKYIDEKRQEAEEKGKLAFWEQEYMASFNESAGRFFPQWIYRTHMYKGTIIPKPNFEIYESIDWGRTAPFAWYAHVLQPVQFFTGEDTITFNRIYTFAELYGTGKSPYEWAEEIVKARKRFRIQETKQICIDPSMLNPLSDGSMSIADQMNEGFEKITGNRWLMVGGSRNRKSRWAAMDNWMRKAIDGLPYWIITKDCPNLARTIPLMEPDENDMEDLNTDLEDHGVDSSSYFLPFIKWIDSGKYGLISRTKPDIILPRAAHVIDPTKFRE